MEPELDIVVADNGYILRFKDQVDPNSDELVCCVYKKKDTLDLVYDILAILDANFSLHKAIRQEIIDELIEDGHLREDFKDEQEM